MDYEVSDVIETYRNVACVPSPSSAFMFLSEKNKVQLITSWSIPDLVKLESAKFSRNFIIDHSSDKLEVYSQGIPSTLSNISLCAFTKDGKKVAYVKCEKKEGKSSDTTFLEIWNSCKLLCSFDMSNRKEHGRIHDTGVFKCLSWSSSGRYLLYIAEKKYKKAESYFKDLYVKTPPESNDDVVKGEEHLYRETWGETYTKVHHSVVCIFDTQDGSVEVVDLAENHGDMSAASVIWGPNDEYVVFIGYEENPRRLGLVYCLNRRACLFSYCIKEKIIECIAGLDDKLWIGFPVFSPDFSVLIFLQSAAFGPHNSGKQLMKIDWKSKKLSTLADTIPNESGGITGDCFVGFYCGLPQRCWSSDGRYIFFSSFRKSHEDIFYFDTRTGLATKIKIRDNYPSCTVLDVLDPYIVAEVSSPSITRFLIIGLISRVNEEIEVTWTTLSPDCKVELSDLDWEIRPFKSFGSIYDDYDAVVLKSKEKNNGTLVAILHGGPHSMIPACYTSYAAAWAKLGYIICIVNYRGSIGYGELSIKSLLGNIGSQDVSDAISVIDALKGDKSLGIKNTVLFGGSHGGFLVTHLIGQYPSSFKAAVVRNPVFNISSKNEISDIPDWSWVESGFEYKYENIADPEVLKKMWEVSPIKHVKKVKTPSLVILGKNDLRVPPSEGLHFYHRLKAQNVPVNVYMYDDNHALSKTDVAADVFVQTALWFQKHVKESKP